VELTRRLRRGIKAFRGYWRILSPFVNAVIRQHDNIAFAIMGHLDRDMHYTVESETGKTQHLFVFDYQKHAEEHFKGAVVKHFTFRPAQNMVEVRTWSADEDYQRYLTGTGCNSPDIHDDVQTCNSFEFDLTME
jgi:hypothetical protein